jgi:hypothetical protein
MKQSYRSINQIFYNNNKFDTSESIRTLEKYCLCDGLLISLNQISEFSQKKTPEEKFSQKISENKIPQKISENKIEENISQKIPEERISQNKTEEKIKWFYPKHSDTLFWCVFSFVYGYDEYHNIGHSYGNRLLEEKMKIIEFIKKNPKAMKESNVKITNMGVQEVISEFMVDKTTSFQGIIALAVYYKTSIYVIHKEKNSYLKFLPFTHSECEKKCYIYYDTYVRGQIKYKTPISEMESPDLDSMICLESHLKPFRPISHYKMEDLEKIAIKMGITPEKRLKKLELYEKLTELACWTSIS